MSKNIRNFQRYFSSSLLKCGRLFDNCRSGLKLDKAENRVFIVSSAVLSNELQGEEEMLFDDLDELDDEISVLHCYAVVQMVPCGGVLQGSGSFGSCNAHMLHEHTYPQPPIYSQVT